MSDGEPSDDEILRSLMQRIYARAEPVAVMTLLRAASRVDRALHLLDRVRDALRIEDDGSPQRDLVARIMRARIARGDYVDGHPLSQAQLAAEFGVTRHMIWPALAALQREGLVSLVDNSSRPRRRPWPATNRHWTRPPT